MSSASEISPEISLSCHPQVICTSSTGHLHVIRTRLQSPKYFQLNTRTALLISIFVNRLVFPTDSVIPWHTLANLMIAKGVGSLLFKWDLKWDPADVSKLVYYLDDLMFFDSTLPMGITSSSCITQCASSIIRHLMQQRGYSCVNYIDYLGGVEGPPKQYLHLRK